jgi:hypothetical protein
MEPSDAQKITQEAKKIKGKLAKGAESVSLDQPFPDELPDQPSPQTTDATDETSPKPADATAKPSKKRKQRRATSNYKVRIIVTVGTLVCLAGVVMMIRSSFLSGLYMVIIGAAVIIGGVFAPIY